MRFSYAKVRALSRVATAESEEDLLQLARVMTAAELERTVRVYRRVTTDEAREQLEATYLSVLWNADGSLEVHGRLAPEDGALLLRALEAQRDASWRGSAEPRPTRQSSNAEALVAVCDASLANTGHARSGAERYQVVVHVGEAVLGDDADGICELADGSALAPETARRLAYDPLSSEPPTFADDPVLRAAGVASPRPGLSLLRPVGRPDRAGSLSAAGRPRPARRGEQRTADRRPDKRAGRRRELRPRLRRAGAGHDPAAC